MSTPAGGKGYGFQGGGGKAPGFEQVKRDEGDVMKWHYFNENDPNCYVKYWSYTIECKTSFYTACGRHPKDVKRHTENKLQVDCLKCLKRLNYKINRELSPLKKAIRQVRGDPPPKSYPHPS